MDSGRWSARPSASASTVETPGSATSAFVCPTHSAISARTSAVTDAPLADVVATEWTPRSSSGWCVTSRSAPHSRASSMTARVGSSGEEDAAHGLVEVARHEADAVPLRRALEGIERLERRDDVAEAEVGGRIVHVGPAGLEPTTPAV